jgi:hypothetical protein
MPSLRASVLAVLLLAMLLGVGAWAQAPAPAFTPSDEEPENFPDGPGREETSTPVPHATTSSWWRRKG